MLGAGVGETKIELEGVDVTGKLELSKTVLERMKGEEGGGREEEGRRRNSELETGREKAGELRREGVGVRKGTRRLSELEMIKRKDESSSEVVGVGVMRDMLGVMGTSQKSPVNPAKHWHVKFSPKSSAKHVPLLQSMKSQICIGGLGEGVGAINVVDSMGMSQKSPVYPGKHWQVKFISNSSAIQVPLLQSIRSQIDGGGRVISQNCPVNPVKHWQVKFSPEVSVIQAPLLQSIRSQIDGDGRSISQNCPVNPVKHWQVNLSPDVSVKFSEVSVTQVPLLQSIRSQICIGGLGEGVGAINVVDSMGTSQKSPVNPAKHWHVKFSPKSSAKHVPLLQSMKSQICIGGLGEGVGAINVVDSIGTSQKSPVNPAKHWHVKFSPKSSAKHVPLLQSMKSQICIGGLGEGVGAIGTSQKSPVYPGKHWQVKFISNSSSDIQVPLLQSIMSQIPGTILGDGDGTRMGISQNMPVHPGKHSQVKVSFSSSRHSPLVQLMKSHSEISGVGEGAAVEVKREAERERLELDNWGTGVEKGTIKLSELSTTKIKDDETVSLMLDRDGIPLTD